MKVEKNYDEALENALSGANILIGDENAIDKAKPHFDKAKEAWLFALEESNPDNKKARVNKKVTSATYYNLGICAYLLKEYKSGIEIMEKVNEVNKGFSDATHYIGKMKDLLDRVNKNSK